MSEFSDCYYYVDGDSKQVGQLLKAVRRFGIVLPAQGRFIPFLVDGAYDAGRALDVVVEASRDLLLHYHYGQEHGVWLTAFRDSEPRLAFGLTVTGLDNEPEEIMTALQELGLTSAKGGAELQQLLTDCARAHTRLAPATLRQRLGHALGLELLVAFGCADLVRRTMKELQRRFPDATFVLKSRRGKADQEIQPDPNEWCPHAAMPAFMYLPVPDGDVEPAMLERHVRYWLETNDFDDEVGNGYWLHSAYQKALPHRMAYLADRLINLETAFEDSYPEALTRTLRGILALSPKDFDWEPYFARRKGGAFG